VAYSIEFSPLAERQFKKLPGDVQTHLKPHIDALGDNPRPSGSRKVQGQKNCHRLRVGDYRIVYDIYDRLLWILVLRIGHRREVYRGELRGKALKGLIGRKLSKKE
jgi:mRNA interferase RelE/StbE